MATLYPDPGPCLGNLLGVGTVGGAGEALLPWVTGVPVKRRAGEAQEALPQLHSQFWERHLRPCWSETQIWGSRSPSLNPRLDSGRAQ